MEVLRLVALILLILMPCYNPFKLLLLGDSLDRHITQEWCLYQRYHRKVDADDFNWGEGSMRYAPKRSSRIPAWICVTSQNQSIAFTHIYGGNATGPYFHHYERSSADPDVDSEIRINKSISSYVHQFGLPDRVIFNTEQWDAQLVYEKNAMDPPVRFSELWNTSVFMFKVTLVTFLYSFLLYFVISVASLVIVSISISRLTLTITITITLTLPNVQRNLNERLDQIIDSLHSMRNLRDGKAAMLWSDAERYKEIDVGLRTSPWVAKSGDIQREFSRIIREISMERNLLLFDYDKEVWGTVDYNFSQHDNLFRDQVHPKPSYSAAAGEKMLVRIYITFVFYVMCILPSPSTPQN